MRNVTIGFLEEVIKPSRTVDAKIVINGHTITSDDIISYEITSSLTDNDMPTIGSAVASSVKFEVTKSSLPMIYVGQKLEFYAGLLVNGTMEWVRVGTFKTTAEYVTKKKLTVEIEAFDEMFWLGNILYESDLTYPTTVATMISELTSKYGLSFSSDILADDIIFHIDPTEQEYSIRSILSQMALLTSSNAVIDSFGDIAFRFLNPTDFEITGENYVDYKRLSEGDIYISQLISKNPELEQTFVSGTNAGVAITVENSGIVSQVQNDDIRNRVYPLTYTAYDMTCQGMPHLEIGDTINFIEVDDTESTLFIVKYSFEYNGGFQNKFTVKAPEKDKVETTPFRSSSSSVTSETIRLTNQALEQAIANASELISGRSGGHVVTVVDPSTGKPQELLILVDSDDVNTATQLWRWNSGGLGFSSTGYDGHYALAMTSDGKIVADAINASELSAIVANLGTVTAGRIQDSTSGSYWDLNSGEIVLNAKSIMIDASGETVPVATLENIAESVTDRASNEDMNTLANIVNELATEVQGKASDGELQDLITDYNERLQQEIIDKQAVSDSLATLEGRVNTVNTILGDKTAKWEFIETSVTMADEGIFIGNEAKQMGVLIAEDRISFMDKGVEVAYISNKTMEITHGIFVQSAIIGKHKIETIPGTNITVFTFVG